MNIHNERLLLTAIILIALIVVGAAIRKIPISSGKRLSKSNIKARFVLAAVAFAPLSFLSSLAFCFLVGLRWLIALPIAAVIWTFVVLLSWSRRKYWNNGQFLDE